LGYRVLFGAKKPVAGITQAGDNVGVIIKLFIQAAQKIVRRG
jgi:hypothetical protein